MRTSEAKNFIHAFTDSAAHSFVKQMLKANYTQAVLSHHPDSKNLDKTIIREKCTTMIDTIFLEIDKIKTKPDELFALFNRLSRTSSSPHHIWFNEFISAYDSYKHTIKLKNRYRQLKDLIRGKTFCDIGCGGGDLVAYIKNNNPEIEFASGIDVMDWRTEKVKEEIGFQLLDFSKPNTKSRKKFDTVTCLAVLHHVGKSDDAINIFLHNLKSALHHGARLIIEEDVIISAHAQQQGSPYTDQINTLKSNNAMYTQFLNFNSKEQLNVLILIDYLANCLTVGVPEMSFPCGFRTIEEWITLFEKNTYMVDEVRIEGFVRNNFNQSSHVLFVLRKS